MWPKRLPFFYFSKYRIVQISEEKRNLSLSESRHLTTIPKIPSFIVMM